MSTLAVAAPAQADVVRVPMGEHIGRLIAAPDGGVWANTRSSVFPGSVRAVVRVRPDGRSVRTPADEVDRGVLGPDGLAYFLAGTHRLLRVDGDGAATPVDLSPATGPALEELLVTGPDGTLWATTSSLDQLAHVTVGGAVTYVASGRRECSVYDPQPFSVARASDGATWIADSCNRLARDGRVSRLVGSATDLVADGLGGVWFQLLPDGALGHATVDGQVSYQVIREARYGLAAAPDGSAWLGTRRCELVRVTPDGTISRIPAPIAADHLVFAGGVLWLANRQLIARADDPRPCDDRAAQLTVPRRMRFGARLQIRLTESAIVDVGVDTGRTGESIAQRVLRPAGTWRVRIPRRVWRDVRGRLRVFVTAEDQEGNGFARAFRVRVTR